MIILGIGGDGDESLEVYQHVRKVPVTFKIYKRAMVQAAVWIPLEKLDELISHLEEIRDRES